MSNNKDYDIKVEGEKNSFDGGAIRYSKDKGRFDLIQEDVLEHLITDIELLIHTNSLKRISPYELIKSLGAGDYRNAIIQISCLKYNEIDPRGVFHTFYTANHHIIMRSFIKMLKDLAIHFQKGAEKYGERNCEKGIPLWSFRDSAMRHTCQFLLGEEDEPHHISAIWNCWLAEWTFLNHPERCHGTEHDISNDHKTCKQLNSARMFDKDYDVNKFKSVVQDFRNNFTSKAKEYKKSHNDASKVVSVKKRNLDGNNVIDKTTLDVLRSISDKFNVVIVTGHQTANDSDDKEKEQSNQEEVSKPDKETVFKNIKIFARDFVCDIGKIIHVHRFNLGCVDEFDRVESIKICDVIKCDHQFEFIKSLAITKIKEPGVKLLLIGDKPPWLPKVTYTKIRVYCFKLCSLITDVVDINDPELSKYLRPFLCGCLKILIDEFGTLAAKQWPSGNINDSFVIGSNNGTSKDTVKLVATGDIISVKDFEYFKNDNLLLKELYG